MNFSKKIKCLIVEDEPIAAEVLQDYVAQVPHLQLVATCRDALYALEVLKTEPVDLIFLDIHLPKLKGIDFVKSLQHKPHIIFTTAYHQYAIEGFEVEALDYLLKPISFPRFLQAVNRVPQAQNRSPEPQVFKSPNPADHLFFNVNKKQVKVMLDDILFLESIKDYVRIYLSDKTIVVKQTLTEMEALLPVDRFMRVHRSFLIAMDRVTAYTSDVIEIEQARIPIGRSYKEIWKERLSR